MATHKFIRCITDGAYFKPGRADRAINEQRSHAWVEFGATVRKLSVAEMLAARAEDSKNRAPLEHAELPGLKFRPTEQGISAHREGRRLAVEAAKFVALG